MNKKTKIIFLFLFFSIINLHAQVGIVTNNPNKDAVLDLSNENQKGLLLPNVKLLGTNDPTPLTSHVKGMHVYNTTPKTELETQK
ncbi:hypothetical protein ACFFWB_27135 [Flavobacterium procerum]|uniref:hypothetical protein n=1 Tax=Flavobacterium procerum TaxID=1455569 RepID=UPI0035EF225E